MNAKSFTKNGKYFRVDFIFPNGEVEYSEDYSGYLSREELEEKIKETLLTASVGGLFEGFAVEITVRLVEDVEGFFFDEGWEDELGYEKDERSVEELIEDRLRAFAEIEIESNEDRLKRLAGNESGKK